MTHQCSMLNALAPSSLPVVQGGVRYEAKPARGILTKATGFVGGPDGYDFTLNPYAGCAFGCTYCYAAFFSRGSISADGEEKTAKERRDSWGKWVDVKDNAVSLLEKRIKSLRKMGKWDGTKIYMSTVTDPYQPWERKARITRGLLDVLARHRVKLVVQTRSPDVVRDIDLFNEMDKSGRVQVNLTVTTDDEEVRKAFEPSCPSNERRLEAAESLDENRVQTCLTLTPLLHVLDPHGFAEKLLATGVRKFVVQDFQFHGGRFVAGTRDVAIDLMADKLGCPRHEVAARHAKRYKDVKTKLTNKLEAEGARVREGKEGFKPPF